MPKVKTRFTCNQCEHISVRWVGCCPQCNEWNTLVEQIVQPVHKLGFAQNSAPAQLAQFQNITTKTNERFVTHIAEWDRVLGGGILPGSFLILTGDPGIGKSTLLLHVAHLISHEHKVFYFSSEESLAQIKKRALRLGINDTNILFSDQAHLEQIIQTGQSEKPDLLILDSIQNSYFSQNSNTTPGSVSLLKEAGFALMRLAKEHNIAVLVTGHITKEGIMAGPKVLEHMVDGVFYLQAADQWQTRMLRSVKNRFGSINELGFFEMQESGLQQIIDINSHLLDNTSNAPGSALTCILEGSRPLLIELQSLCVESKFGIPQRVITGIDPKRVILIAAILEKYLHVKMSSHDIFFKVTGGIKLVEHATDLCIALTLLSSYFQQPLPTRGLALGEISLSGDIKPINHVDVRIKEAEKFGITTHLLSAKQTLTARQGGASNATSSKTLRFKNMYELLKLFPEK